MSYRICKNGYKFSFKRRTDCKDDDYSALETPKFISIQFAQNSICKPKSTRNVSINFQDSGISSQQQINYNEYETKRKQALLLNSLSANHQLDSSLRSKSVSNCTSRQQFNDETIRKQKFQTSSINININISNQQKILKKQLGSNQLDKKDLLKGTRRNLNKIWSEPKKNKITDQKSINLINLPKSKGISELLSPKNINKKFTEQLNWKKFQNNSIIDNDRLKIHRNLRIKTQQQRSFGSSKSSHSLGHGVSDSPIIRKDLNYKGKTQQIRPSKSQLINIVKLPSPNHKQLPLHLFTRHKEIRVIPEAQLNPSGFLELFKSNKNRAKKMLFLKKQVPKNNQYIQSKMQQLNKKLKLLQVQTECNFDASGS